MTNGTTEWEYTYSAEGLSIQRINGNETYGYVYKGSNYLQHSVKLYLRCIRFAHGASQ